MSVDKPLTWKDLFAYLVGRKRSSSRPFGYFITFCTVNKLRFSNPIIYFNSLGITCDAGILNRLYGTKVVNTYDELPSMFYEEAS